MGNSPLVSYTRISPNRGNLIGGKWSPERTQKIDTITIHCVVGQLSVEALGDLFANPSKEASSNYGIGPDGRIGLYCEEKDRSWCSSSSSNDNRAVTIECASEQKHPFAINEKVYWSLIELCVDICKRNGISSLKWKADKALIGQVDKQNMTVHRWFASKSCPGDYIYNRLGDIAKEVNRRLNGVSTEETVYPTPPFMVEVTISEVVGDWGRLSSNKGWLWLGKGVSIGNSIESPTDKVSEQTVEVKVAKLNIRSGPGTNHFITGSTGPGIFTIVEETIGQGSVKGWGKLKSGAGWVSLDYAVKKG